MQQQKSWLRDLILLTLLIGAAYSVFLGSRPLMVPDEGRYAEIPREMVVSGNYVTPHLDGIIYFEKPALFYWLQAASIKAFGVNQWAVRIPTALLALLGALMTYVVARKLYGRRCGWLSALVLASSGLYIAMAHIVTIDMTVAVFIASTLFCFLLGSRAPPGKTRRNWLWAMYALAALATLSKGLIGVILPGMVIFLWILAFNQWRELKHYYLPSGFLIFLIIALPWHIAVQLQNPEFFHQYFINQQFLRYLTPIAGRSKPLWFMPAVLIGGLMPWTVFLLQAIVRRWLPDFKQATEVKRTTGFLFIWIISIFGFFWYSNSQLAPYILPIFPALAILLGRYFDSLWTQAKSTGLTVGFSILLLAAVGAGIAVFFIPPFHGVMHPLLAQHYVKVSLIAAAVFMLLSCIAYFWRGIKFGLPMLMLTICVGLTAFNLTYPYLDARPVISLAKTLKPMLKPNTPVYTYLGYYQDLPFYLQRTVTIVGGYGELMFGIRHQKDIEKHAISPKILWERWNKPPQQYMIMGLGDYQRESKVPGRVLYKLAQTTRNVLVTNVDVGK